MRSKTIDGCCLIALIYTSRCWRRRYRAIINFPNSVISFYQDSMSDRRSLLVQAGDGALALMRFGRRRQSVSVRQAEVQVQVLALPHVLDISAPPPDEELEERQRLRDAAAQSIGLGPALEAPSPIREEAEEEEEAAEELPLFPSSVSQLKKWSTQSATLPKYYPPPSLRIFALAKQWKPRHLLFSASASIPGAHLHLFKGPAPDDRELERLAIGADSVVFVAESSPSNSPDGALIVKVGGQDVGAHRRDWNATDDAGRTVWLLHCPTSAEAQRWISAIKTAIFEQRTQRAGLPAAQADQQHQEPRGDMDVMLEIRRGLHAQSTSSPSSIASYSSPTSPSSAPPTHTYVPSEHRPPRTPTSPTASIAPTTGDSTRSLRSVHSVRSAQTTPAPSHSHPPKTAVAALKGLFSPSAPHSAAPDKHRDKGSNRPRSASAASVGASVRSLRSLSPSVRLSSLSTSTTASVGGGGRPGLTRALSASGPNPHQEDRGSFARMGSLLAGGGGAKKTLPIGEHVGGAQIVGGKGDLERRIVEGERDALPANGNGHAASLSEGAVNGGAVNANANGKRRTLGGLNIGLTLTSLQPPPRGKRWTMQSRPTSSSSRASSHSHAAPTRVDEDGGGSPSTTAGTGSFYAHPHANGSAATAGSFGVPAHPAASSVRLGRDVGEGGSINGHSVHREGSINGTAHREGSLRSSRSRASSVGTHGTGQTQQNGSGSGQGSAGAQGHGGRRWSTLPRRLTPPSAPPPLPPPSAPRIAHPYAAAASPERERPPSRASGRSFGSRSGELALSASPGKMQSTWGRGGKRASGVSVGSQVSIGGTSESSVAGAGVGVGVGGASGAGVGVAAGGRHRVSVPPPPRPAPTGALPPAPGERPASVRSGSSSFRESMAPPSLASSTSLPVQGTGHTKAMSTTSTGTGTGGKASFRESMSLTHRALRLSLMAPKPPPAGVLPPRPDEAPLQEPVQNGGQNGHARKGSGVSVGGRVSINSNGSGAGPAFPPPHGPLPPTPSSAPTAAPAPGHVRNASLKFKHRIRILSAPATPHEHAHANAPPHDPRRTSADSGARLMTIASFLSASTPSTPTSPAPPALAQQPPVDASVNVTPPPPGTPIGEKIIQWHTQNDPSFLQLGAGPPSAASTPVLRSLPALPADPPPPASEGEYAEIVSLSPPPRRGSRQISIKDAPTPTRTPTPEPEPEPHAPPGKLFSLSRHGSVISLGIVTV
ncbi:hypothetical protein DFH07DRAFT_1024515 [Mycena maculata]|uniref:PH domain-containing protein n=1 Tax=Mycena maculata TaxID=230809 RepID=A0AAD7NG78_9AGAR|nr:hypothetical protein DFH07DRAFT_1024515 [Mycena maculata]